MPKNKAWKFVGKCIVALAAYGLSLEGHDPYPGWQEEAVSTVDAIFDDFGPKALGRLVYSFFRSPKEYDLLAKWIGKIFGFKQSTVTKITHEVTVIMRDYPIRDITRNAPMRQITRNPKTREVTRLPGSRPFERRIVNDRLVKTVVKK
jgi:hypothetical protein